MGKKNLEDINVNNSQNIEELKKHAQ